MALGDTHGNAHFVNAALGLAKKAECDVVYVVGDFGIWDHIPAGVKFLDAVSDIAGSMDLKVYFCDGNHENFDSLYSIPLEPNGLRYVRENIIHTPRGYIWQWDDVKFMAMGGAHSIDGPNGADWWQQARGPTIRRGEEIDLGGWWPEETITDEDIEAAEKSVSDLGTVDIMFSHDMPWDIPLPQGWNDYDAGQANRKMLRKAVDLAQPKTLIHGHYHKHWKYTWKFDHDFMDVIGLAHDGGVGQYMYIDTDPLQMIVPDFS